MSRRPPARRLKTVLAVALAAALTLALAPAEVETDTTDASGFPPQLVTVDTPTRADKDLLTTLGLDLTEHAGHDYVEVVLHTEVEAEALRAAGFTWDVRIADMIAREAEIQAANRAYAASTDESELPSGSTSYRTLDEYNLEMRSLAASHDEARLIELPTTSLEGRTVYGLEIADDVGSPPDGRPVMVMLGLHHAREWPSGEHTIEFAYDLLKHADDGGRIERLLQQTRVIVVPVVNVDGFQESITDGMTLDLRELDGGGLVSNVATANNAYKRKNCRVIDGQRPVSDAECTAAKSPGGFGIGIDLNRNYGAFWGGPGASDIFADATYHGAGPFSEPVVQGVRELISTRHVTTMISNHTFSNLVLRPNGVSPDTIGPDGFPVGFAPDEQAMKELGAEMTAENGYANIHGWQLYDTTGTTEDWSYNATGGFGYTFEIGPNEFHPPYPQMIDEYVGDTEAADGGGGNREAFLIALENAADAATHSVLRGKAPAGATLRLERTGSTPTWDSGSFTDTVSTAMQVGDNGRFTWHTNPSTRPLVESRQYRVLSDEPLEEPATYTGTTAPGQQTDNEYVLDRDADVLRIDLDWPTPDDLDLYVYRKEGDELVEVGSGTSFVGEKEQVLLEDPQQGTYVLRVENFASVAPQWELTASLFDSEVESTRALIEAWTLSCEVDGEILQQEAVVVDRGDRVKVDLRECRREARAG